MTGARPADGSSRQEHPGLGHQGLRDGQHLLLAAAQLAGPRSPALPQHRETLVHRSRPDGAAPGGCAASSTHPGGGSPRRCAGGRAACPPSRSRGPTEPSAGAGTAVTSWPSSRTEPAVTRFSPATARSVVVLPAPLLPSSTEMRPGPHLDRHLAQHLYVAVAGRSRPPRAPVRRRGSVAGVVTGRPRRSVSSSTGSSASSLIPRYSRSTAGCAAISAGGPEATRAPLAST